jgi:hypothetical protein
LKELMMLRCGVGKLLEVPKALGKERNEEGSAEVKKRSSGEGRISSVRTLPKEGHHSGLLLSSE